MIEDASPMDVAELIEVQHTQLRKLMESHQAHLADIAEQELYHLNQIGLIESTLDCRLYHPTSPIMETEKTVRR